MTRKANSPLGQVSAILLLALLALLPLAGPYPSSADEPGGGQGPRPGPQPQSPAAAGGGRWVWQNPLPQGNSLFAIEFVDAQTGWAVGDNGTILRYYGTYPTRAFLPFLARNQSTGW